MEFLYNFFVYGFIGWIIENVFSYYIHGHFQKDGFFESILFYFYIRLTNKRIKRSPYSFPGSAISVFLLCKIPSERANLIFFSINSLLKHLPIYIMIRLFRQKTTLFFGNPYTTNLF